VGDCCKAIASRVRGAVAASTFDDFHRNSARIIRSAVFGLDDNNKVKATLFFPANNLTISNIDIQSVEPVDHRTRDSLQKSVQLAIEITTNSQEANARHEAMRIEQQAKGKLERQKLLDEAKSEDVRRELTRLQALSATVEITGQTTAEAKARTEAAEIESRAAVTQARLRAEAQKIEAEEALKILEAKRLQEIEHRREIDKLEVEKATQMAEIETQKFKSLVDAIGKNTLKTIAQAGPELQARLLNGLGLKSFMITDGNSPINLFNTANGLIGGLQHNTSSANDIAL